MHGRSLILGFVLAQLFLTACQSSSSDAEPSNTPRPSASAHSSASPAPSNSPQASSNPSASPSASATPGASPSASPSPSPNPVAGEGNPRDFGEANSNMIRPGVQVISDTGSCTSNFIYHDAQGVLYIGAAAHCFSPDTNSGVDSCETDNLPYGSAVNIENASMPGELVYSSWHEMQQRGEIPGSEVCDGNDFALVKIHADDQDKVHPSAIVFGGPNAMYEGNASVGDTVYSYGQSPFHFGVGSLEEKQGRISSQSAEGWTYNISTDNPGLSGDSGSAVLHESGRALGILVTVGVGLGGAVNGVCNLELALGYAIESLNNNFWLTTSDTFTP